jgi:LmbE family N-acetylglucosaminyl deacetylase
VVSAHAGDFVWRAAGAIALATSRGERAKVLCLSFGERGESAKAWREGRELAEIKAMRRAEAEAAAAVLGAEIEFLDAGDYPLLESPELVDRMVRVYREVNPSVQHMWDYYTDLAKRRGVQVKRNAGPNLGLPHNTMGEAYMRLYPQVTTELA